MITITVLLSILILGIILAISSLIFWGLGCLVVSVFGIAYTWTFWHGVVCALVYALIKDMFKITTKRN